MSEPDMHRVKLGFALQSQDESWPPVAAEWLWFESREPFVGGRYRLVSVPWFVAGVALGDTIEAAVDETSTVTSWEVTERSGNDLVWLLVNETDLWSEIDALCDLGCLVENYQDFHFAASVPAGVDAHGVDAVLERVMAKGGQVAFPVWQREAA